MTRHDFLQTAVFLSGTLAALLFVAPLASADGGVVGQIYAPYVQPLEREVELVWVNEEPDGGFGPADYRWMQVGYGTSLWEGVYTELSARAVDDGGTDYHQLELETVWQLTEQGEYRTDWGLLVELETSFGRSANEVTVGLLNSFDVGRFTVLSNLRVIQEWGADLEDELETALAVQARYRLRYALEPSFEVFAGQNTLAAGPGIAGLWRLDGPDQLRWNLVALKGFKGGTDFSLKLELEYEFF